MTLASTAHLHAARSGGWACVCRHRGVVDRMLRPDTDRHADPLTDRHAQPDACFQPDSHTPPFNVGPACQGGRIAVP